MKCSLLCIIGPTAVGKTSLAFMLLEKLNAHILSVDSRQVYKGLEITSGADIPKDWKYMEGEDVSYFRKQNQKIFGVSCIKVDEEWSVAHFKKMVKSVINICKKEKKNLILVGGSGFYIHALHIRDQDMFVSPNEKLRKKLNSYSLSKLQDQLTQLWPERAKNMNQSDWNNPRRLIRAIEIGQEKKGEKKHIPSPTMILDDAAWIGLTVQKEELKKRIRKRVKQRIQQGSIQEVERLLKYYGDQIVKLPALSSLGVSEIQSYLSHKNMERLVDEWTLHEVQYSKKQMTWFKKMNTIQWFSISEKNWETKITAYLFP